MASLNDMVYISKQAFEKNFPMGSAKYNALYKLQKGEPQYDQEAICAKLISKLKYPTDKMYIKFKNINELRFEGMITNKGKVSKYQNGVYMSADANKMGFYLTIDAYLNLRHTLKENIDQEVELPKALAKFPMMDYSKFPTRTTGFSKKAKESSEEESSSAPEDTKPVESKSKKEKEKKSKKEPSAEEESSAPEEPKSKKEKKEKKEKKVVEAPAEESSAEEAQEKPVKEKKEKKSKKSEKDTEKADEHPEDNVIKPKETQDPHFMDF